MSGRFAISCVHSGCCISTAVLLVTLCSNVQAADIPVYSTVPGSAPIVAPVFPFISEVRAGAYAHDPLSPEKGSADLNAEVLFAKPFRLQGPWDFLMPRPHLGATISFAGRTSAAYAGFNWTYDVTRSIFVEASLGGAVHNGSTSRIVPPHSNAMGCSVTFHESAGLGYRLTERWSVMANIEHFSNAGLCKANRGLTNYGFRVGYSF